MLTNFKRVFKFALRDFFRNRGISLAAIFVLTITIGLVTGLFFLHGISNFIISSVEQKIDVTAYFKSDTAEQDILTAKDQLLKDDPDIKSIQYISKEVALSNFTQKHSDNPVFSNALTEVGDNPFLPSLNITTNGNAQQYQKIADLLQTDKYSGIIDRVDYSQKKDTIDKIFSITSMINRVGIGLAVLLVLVAILVVFNTIKLAIDSAKDEISIMRTVGASSWFVRAPFVIQGVFFGCISFVVCFMITALLAYVASLQFTIFLSGFNLWNYFLVNFWIIILLQLGFGVGLGVVASFIVVQKYLQI